MEDIFDVVSTLEEDHFDRQQYVQEFTEVFRKVEEWSILRGKLQAEELLPDESGFYSPKAT